MPLWSRWAGNPSIFISGIFGNGYGAYYPGWIGEQFQYSNKVAGIGWVHTIRREFTFAETLLERAEAKIMKGDYDSATEDLITYHASTQKFSTSSMQLYSANNGMRPLEAKDITDWFAKKTKSNHNCYDDWNFVTNMSPDYVIPASAVPYMNCLNYFRRYETNFTGMRFFYLKRWGIEYTHEYGLTNVKYTLTWNDPRRAIEVPQDAIAMGLQPSRPVSVDSLANEHVIPAAQVIGEYKQSE
jgi:hypothetical protein